MDVPLDSNYGGEPEIHDWKEHDDWWYELKRIAQLSGQTPVLPSWPPPTDCADDHEGSVWWIEDLRHFWQPQRYTTYTVPQPTCTRGV